MDIFNYLNSRELNDCCRKSGYVFSPAEQVFIIQNWDHITLSEKHRLYDELLFAPAFSEHQDFYTLLHVFKDAERTAFGQLEYLVLESERCGLKVEYEVTDRIMYLPCPDYQELCAVYDSFHEAYDAMAQHRERTETANHQNRGFISVRLSGDTDRTHEITISVGQNAIITAIENAAVRKMMPKLFADTYRKLIGQEGIPIPFQAGDLVAERFPDDEFRNPCIVRGIEYDSFGRKLSVYRFDCDHQLTECSLDLLQTDGYHGEMTDEIKELIARAAKSDSIML